MTRRKKPEHFPLNHKQARTFGLSDSDKALQKLLGQCSNNTQRIRLLVEALDLARDEASAANTLIERERCAKIAESYGLTWGENRDIPAELVRLATNSGAQIPSLEIADAIRSRKP